MAVGVGGVMIELLKVSNQIPFLLDFLKIPGKV